MSKTSFRKELKKPDEALSAMRKLFDAIVDNKKAALGLFVVLGVGWFAYWYYTDTQQQKADRLFGELYEIEKNYQDHIKNIEAENNELAKDTKNKSGDLEKALKEKKEEALQKFLSDLKSFVQKAPQGQAAGLAALKVTSQLMEEKKWDEAVSVLDPSKDQFKTGSLLHISALMSLGRIHENLEKWEAALANYQEAEKRGLEFPSSLFKMAQARCYTKLGKGDEALKIYETIEKDKDDPFSNKARGFRRLMRRKEKSS